jgi:hypothetical protein
VATDQHSTIEELLETVLSLGSDSRLYNEDTSRLGAPRIEKKAMALVSQKAAYIRHHYSGDLNVDLGSKENWQEELSEHVEEEARSLEKGGYMREHAPHKLVGETGVRCYNFFAIFFLLCDYCMYGNNTDATAA